jgi:hypothetical protein
MAIGNMVGRTIKFEDWKGDARSGRVVSILDNGDFEVSTDSGMALVSNDEIIKMRKGGYVPKSKKLTARQQAKLEKVLHEFKMGELHSGSKHGPVVKSRKQALAIGLAEARSVKMARGGSIKELSFDNSNLYFYGFGRDTNGNTVVKVGFPNQKAFSIQINNPQFRNTYSLKSNKVSEISESNLNKIEKEVVDYIKSFGSAKQKSTLKVYSGFKMAQGGSIKVGDTVTLPEIKMKNGDVQFEKVENGEVIYITDGIYGVKNPKTNRIHQVTSNQIKMAKGGSMGWKHKMAKGGGVGEKMFSINPHSIGKAKYVIDYYDGKSKHNDGSPFIGIKTFSNKIKLEQEVKKLKSEGYTKVSNVFNAIK